MTASPSWFVPSPAIMLALALLLAPAPAAAQSSNSRAENEVITVIGTRVRGLAYDDLSVAVDVYDATQIRNAGNDDLALILQRIAPSFNSKRNVLGDGGLFHTAVLRGMNPDHTLVLINGKRRHGISFPRPLDATGQGTTGTDLRAIPVASIERIEVLRDGAASQYGSDAIGGVINIVLKGNTRESVATVSAGGTTEGDGDRHTTALNFGLEIGARGGFANVTSEYTDQNRIDRAFDTRPLDPDGQGLDQIGPRKNIHGEPEHYNKTLFVNMEIPVTEAHELYAFGGYSQRHGVSSGAWRDPVWATERIVGPLHPDGFLPLEISDTEDVALTLGLRTDRGGWVHDVSFQTGANEFDFGAGSSANASWAAEWLANELQTGRNIATVTADEVIANSGPNSGDSGGTKLEDRVFNFDTAGTFDWWGEAVNAAFGAEYRDQRFRIRAGDFASYGCGSAEVDFDGDNDPLREGNRGFPAVTFNNGVVGQHTGSATCGHQGYPGYSPLNAQLSRTERNSRALYADFQLDHGLFHGGTWETALRWEDYSDAGTQLTGKIGFQAELGARVSMRLSASTGFRAPSLPQKGFNTVLFSGGDAAGLSVTAHLEDGAAHDYFNAGPSSLDHETSKNLAAGLVWQPTPDFSLSFDLYHIALDDRIALTGFTADCTGIHRDSCTRLANDRNLPQTISNVSYYDNIADTTTEGGDLVARYQRGWLAGDLTLTGALHLNKTRIKDVHGVIEPETRSYIEDGNPKQRRSFAADWQRGPWDTHLAFNYFGKTKPFWLGFSDCGPIDSAWLTDVGAGYTFGKLRLSAGLDNLFNNYPNRINQACADVLNSFLGWGFRYNPDASYGSNGRLWSIRLDATF